MSKLRHGVSLVLEHLLRFTVAPKLRAIGLKLFGATIGKNVRVYECRFMNLRNGFCNLYLEDDVHIGPDCLIDLEGPVRIGQGATLSPRVTVMSHSDPGTSHGSPLADQYPYEASGIEIGKYCWIGANATILSGAKIGSGCVIGAMALVSGELDADSIYVGIPANKVRAVTREK